nr:nuclear transport factor 2 family protein [Pyrinomonadaceae bacterium]
APYNSPEQRAGEEPDGRSDLYSLGVILYEMLAGQLPFTSQTANTEKTSASNDREEQLLPLRNVRADVPEAVAQLVMQSLQSKPSSRPFSAEEFARQLRTDAQPATQLKQNATVVTQAPAPSDTDAAPIRRPDAPAVKAISPSREDLPSVTASVLSPLVASETTAQQSPTHAERAPEQRHATVSPETVATLIENKSQEAQEINPAPRRIIINFEDETIFEGQKPGEAAGLLASPFIIASTFVAESIPEKTPSSTPQKHHAPVLKQVARRSALASIAIVVALTAVVATLLAFNHVTFRSASSHAETSDVRTTDGAPNADGRADEAQTARQVPASQQNSPSAETNGSSASEDNARAPLAEIETASTQAPANSASVSETTRVSSVDERSRTPQFDAPPSPPQEANERAALRAARDRWLAATNERDVEKQMSLYMPRVDAFYSSRNASRAAVRDHKARVFAGAHSIEMRAGEPEIVFDRSGRTATMRFRKTYLIRGRGGNNRGEAVQELRWTRTNDGWRIASERNLSARETEESAERSRETRASSAARGREERSSANVTRPRRAIEDATRPRRAERTTTTPAAKNSEAGARRRGKKG